jgi:hypothetical protein
MSNRLTRLAADRRGVALPVALFGLVVVSLLVTTALLTSSTEYAISAAHRTAAGSLYNADASLEQYLFDRAQIGGASWLANTDAGVARGPDGRNYQVQVARMSWNTVMTTDPMTATELYSLVALPQDGRGRGVGAFVRTVRSAPRLNANINAGATSGGDLKVSGNATISDGRSGVNYCNAQDSTSDYAVQVTKGSKIDLGNQAERNLEGAADTADFTKAQLEGVILGPNLTLRGMADMAQYKFGDRWSQPDFRTTTIDGTNTVGADTMYNWGCPQQLLVGFACPSGSATRFRTVAIDAGGGSVKINGRYGQGVIIVLNGSLEIQGNFTFKGIILVEKDMYIRGGAAGQESKIEGGVIAFGQSSTVEDNITGTATIKYNTCANAEAMAAFNQNSLQNAVQRRSGSTFAWYELIR